MQKELRPGVYTARRKNGSIYYRASITYKNKHISLGSYDSEDSAGKAYEEADRLLYSDSLTIADHESRKYRLPFDKWVVLCNFRDNGIYIPNPIYVRTSFFYYYFSKDDFFLFSSEDLFYYSAHRIQRRGGHYFVADYGSQISIYSRYGIKSHAVCGRDYILLNGNPQDLQYSNIKVINSYHGVCLDLSGDKPVYDVKIHVNGYYKVGCYPTAIEAAVAYNKAADIIKEAGIVRQFPVNYIDGISAKSYADLYTSIKISPRLYHLSV